MKGFKQGQLRQAAHAMSHSPFCFSRTDAGAVMFALGSVIQKQSIQIPQINVLMANFISDVFHSHEVATNQTETNCRANASIV